MTIKQQLAKLRKEWVKYPERRKTIELQAMVLNSGLMSPEKIVPDNPFYKHKLK
jgi:hypothetical protein